VGANSFAMQAAGLPCKAMGVAARPLANEFAPTDEAQSRFQTASQTQTPLIQKPLS
jgi:hypothetical protein